MYDLQVYPWDTIEAMRAILAFEILVQPLAAHLFIHYFSLIAKF